MISADSWLLLGLLWVLVGAGVGWKLHTRQQPAAAVAALLFWPLLLPALSSSDPLQRRINAELRQLQALSRAEGIPIGVAALRQAMLDAVADLRRLDALLADLERTPHPALSGEADRIRQHRARTEDAIERVLAAALQLRIQASLSGPTTLTADLKTLQAQLHTLTEVAAISGGRLTGEEAR